MSSDERRVAAREDRSPHARRDLVGLAALAAVLLLTGLGRPILWSDEADTAFFARTIVQTGLPVAWDGRSFVESDRGARLTPDLVLVGTPPLPYYLTAASFALLGESAGAARLPFALAGIACVGLLYALVRRTTGDRSAALAAALLLLASVQFLLYARECRHYALNMLLSLAWVLAFVRLRRRPREAATPLVGTLLFYTHPLAAAALGVALTGVALLHPGFAALRLRWLLRLAAMAVACLPWVWLSAGGMGENASLLLRGVEWPNRLAQLGIESLAAVPALGWLLLLPAALSRLRPGDREWLALAGAALVGIAATAPLVLNVYQLWSLGLRYFCAVLPFACGITGLLLVRAAAGRPARLAALGLLFAATHLPARALPWLVLGHSTPQRGATVAMHVPNGLVHQLLHTEWLAFARELFEANPGVVSATLDVLREEAAPDDTVVTNFDWEPLAFHAPQRVGYTILPHFPIAEAARRHGLPASVFELDGARWLVWRWVWEGYQGYRFREVEAALRKKGADLVRVASLEETYWENRPELHFRRLLGFGHLFRWSGPGGEQPFPRAEVYRVDWPGGVGPDTSYDRRVEALAASLEGRPENASLRARVEAALDAITPDPAAANRALRQDLERAGLVPLRVPGLLYRTHPETGADLASVDRWLGGGVALVETGEAASVEENALRVAEAVRASASEGRRVVLVSASKGSADVRQALESEPALGAQVAGWVDLVGVLEGTPLTDPDSPGLPVARELLPDATARSLSLRAGRSRVSPARFPAATLALHVAAFPRAGEVSRAASPSFAALRPLGPNDGYVLLDSYLRAPGRVLVVRGADHYLRVEGLLPRLTALLRVLVDEVLPAQGDPRIGR
jgi:4-amino-4-deoxy-L-arabinose transferase-like glycosyltransferase